MSFEVKTQQLGLAILEQNNKTLKRVKKSITNDINALKETLNQVKEVIDDKRKVLSNKFWDEIKYEDADYIEKTFKPIIKLRTKKAREVIELELDDIIAEQQLIHKTKTTTSEFVSEYRKKVESAIKELADDNPTISRIMKGEEPNDEELMDLEHALYSINEDFAIDTFRKVFKQPTGSLGQFIKYVLGLYDFPSYEDECANAFDSFIKEHEDWNADQVLFVRTVKNTIAQRGKVEVSDLYESPFDRIGTPNKLFEEDDVEDIIMVCKTLEKRHDAIS